MNNTDNTTSSWERIQGGVRDAERLLGQKKYNMAMVKARQTLEFMVKCLCERYDIVEGGLIDMIDGLYENGIISKTTCEHYHKIRTIGNKAIHEEDNNAYNANQAHHLLSQEVYTFANDYNNRKKRTSQKAPRQTPEPINRPGPRAQNGQRRSGGSASASQRSRRKSRSMGGLNPNILKLLIPLAIIIVLILIIQLFPKKKDAKDLTTTVVSTEATVAPTVPATTEVPTTAAPVTTYTISGTNVNVRSAPDTTATILGKLSSGTVVEYVKEENAEWVVINYNGAQAYVSKQFITSTTQ